MDELQQEIENLRAKLVDARNQLMATQAELEGKFDTRLVAFAKMPYSGLVALFIVGLIFYAGMLVG